LQSPEYSKAVEPVDAIDAIHEIPGIEHSDEDYICYNYYVPVCSKEIEKEKHKGETCNMTDKPLPLTQAVYIVDKAYNGYQCHAGKEEPVISRRPDENSKRGEPEYYSSPTNGAMSM